MAKQINETPKLMGKDAIRFFQFMKKAKNEKVPAEIRDRIKENYNKLKSISNFDMSYQICPKCNGKGRILSNANFTTENITDVCNVCDGKMIISTSTGQPPK